AAAAERAARSAAAARALAEPCKAVRVALRERVARALDPSSTGKFNTLRRAANPPDCHLDHASWAPLRTDPSFSESPPFGRGPARGRRLLSRLHLRPAHGRRRSRVPPVLRARSGARARLPSHRQEHRTRVHPQKALLAGLRARGLAAQPAPMPTRPHVQRGG